MTVFCPRMPVDDRSRRLALAHAASPSTRALSDGTHSADLAWRGVVAAAVDLALPIVVLHLAIASAPWRVLAEFQPDLAYWLYAVGIVLFVKGVMEVSSLRRLSARRRMA